MWYDVLTNPKQVKALREDRSMLLNFLFDYEYSEYWEEIFMITGVPNPGGVPCTKTEKKKLPKHYKIYYVSARLHLGGKLIKN